MKNEKLQSRREFFKNAAKATLPILGGIALANLSITTQASQIMGCDNSCTNSCLGGCKGGCHISCAVGCKGACAKSSK